MATFEPALEKFQAANRDLAALTRRKPPPTWEEVQAASAKLRANIESLIAAMHHLRNSAVIAEFSAAALAADSWKDLHEHFSRVLLILERIFKHQTVAEPKTESLLKHAIGIARVIVNQADQEYRRYNETARSEEIPESFFAGLEDIRTGRVVDMEQALNEPPPKRA